MQKLPPETQRYLNSAEWLYWMAEEWMVDSECYRRLALKDQREEIMEPKRKGVGR